MTDRRAMPLKTPGLAALWLAILVAAPLATACSTTPDEAHTLEVLAGSELRDLEPLFPELERATGIRLSLTYLGTLEGAEQIVAGNPADAAWFSHGKYLSLLPEASGKIVASEKTMLSPVVVGVKQSVAATFGWDGDATVTWKDIQQRVAAGEFRFAMTNPAASNSGFTALVGVAAALSGSSDSLDTAVIDKAALREFFKGQSLTAGSSGFLAEAYVRDEDRLDGMVNYESVLLGLNKAGELDEPLTLVYPNEGIVTADYPFMLLNADKREAWDEVVAWLRTPDIQRRIMADTLRRPAVPGVPLDSVFPNVTLVELPFPSKLSTIDSLLQIYLDEVRRPASAIFVLDTSGSMEGERIDDLKRAMQALTGTDESLTGRFSRFRAREEVTIVTFSGQVNAVREFTIDDTDPDGPDMTEVRTFVDGIFAEGATAIYDALERAYDLAESKQLVAPDLVYSIVLMTDGENTDGIDLRDFQMRYRDLPDAMRTIPTYPVHFGESNLEELESVAELTGGRLFDAANTSLATIFKQIRGYQ